MRAVNKGLSPYDKIKKYTDAMPYLKQRLGSYCSYCEMRLRNSPEVEHVCSKSNDGSLIDWNNLLIACKQCNCHKHNKINISNLDDYIWPDTDNTAVAFTYDESYIVVNEPVLLEIDPSGKLLERAKALYDLLDLGHIPKGITDKDNRQADRLECYETATQELEDWLESDNKNSITVEGIVRFAKAIGHFSIWLEVFKDVPEIIERLLEEFPGTNYDCYENGRPRKIILSRPLQRYR